MPDRVIDAPIPEDLKVHYSDSMKGLPDGINWTDDFVLELIERIARLEAEKQDARTEGWNAAIEAAAKAVDGWEFGGGGYDESARDCIDRLSKPTAVKQEESPSSANRAEGRQG